MVTPETVELLKSHKAEPGRTEDGEPQPVSGSLTKLCKAVSVRRSRPQTHEREPCCSQPVNLSTSSVNDSAIETPRSR